MIDASPGASHVSRVVRDAMAGFHSGKEDPLVAYVSKMVAIPESELPENKRRGGALTADEARELGRKKRAEIAKAQALASHQGSSDALDAITNSLGKASIASETSDSGSDAKEQPGDPEHLIGFARLYSGTLSVGDEVFVLPPKFSPAHPNASPEPQKTVITALYLLMGRGLEPLSSVPAGTVFGVAGLEGRILKSGTLSSVLEGGVNLAGISMVNQPIVRVALEPVNPSDLGKLIAGMRLLEQSDPCAEHEVLESGEHVISTAGELHLERCLKDLRERFARCEIQAGEPIVPYRETIVSAPEMVALKDKSLERGQVVAMTTSKQVSIRVRVRPIPSAVTEFLVRQASAIRKLYLEKRDHEEGGRQSAEAEAHDMTQTGLQQAPAHGDASLGLADFKRDLVQAFDNIKGEREFWKDAIDKIAAFGPRRVGPNLLIDTTSGCCRRL